MTATPTPLRELPAKWRSEACDIRHTTNEPGPHDGARAEELEACADELEAALSARDEAGAVAWAADDFYSNHPLPILHDDPAINMELLVQALTNRLDTARQALAAVAAMQVVQPALQQVKANAAWAMSETDPRRLLPRSVAYNATPPAASGDNSITQEQAVRAIDAAVDALNDSGWPALSAEVREALTFFRLAAVAPAGMDGWQPIETAPKDGTRVLLGNPVWIAADTGTYDDGEWRDFGFSFTPEPTHWQPLPTPPATAGQEGES